MFPKYRKKTPFFLYITRKIERNRENFYIFAGKKRSYVPDTIITITAGSGN